jgi:hypothetical protein
MMMENIKQILNENGRTISDKDRGLASMMDNEPRTEDRSPEGLIFSIDSDIKNLMKEYEIAVRDGDNERAQRIADIINELDAKKIGISGGMADKNMDKNPEQTLKAIELQLQTLKKQNIQAVKNNDFNTARLISQEENKLKQIKNDLLQEMGMSIPAEKPRPFMPGDYIASPIASGPQEEIPPMPENFAEGGEAEMPEMSEQEAMAELEGIAPQAQMIEQLIMAVIKMIQQGVSEAEVREFLKEQGLDDEDIEDLFMMVMEQIEQAPAEEPIGRELQGMM